MRFAIDRICRICGTEGETIEHIISSCTVLVQSEYKKRHDIFANVIRMNLAVKFNLLMDTQPPYIYKVMFPATAIHQPPKFQACLKFQTS
jgi:hypothetical protein